MIFIYSVNNLIVIIFSEYPKILIRISISEKKETKNFSIDSFENVMKIKITKSWNK